MNSSAHALGNIQQTLRPLYEFLFPPTCLACDNPLNESEWKICVRCWSSIGRLTVDDALYREKSAQLIARGYVDGLASVFHFDKDGTLQNLIHQFKYNEMTSIGIEMGKHLAATLPAMLGALSFDGLVPVPLHRTKERERGYNQSEFVCKGISLVTGLAMYPHLLTRVRHTKTQTKLDAHERRENVAGAFTLTGRYATLIPHSSFLVVDDIITTGATIDECARVLKAGGAEKVYAASIALPDLADMQRV